MSACSARTAGTPDMDNVTGGRQTNEHGAAPL